MNWYCASCGHDMGVINKITADQNCPECFGSAFSTLRPCETRTLHGVNCACTTGFILVRKEAEIAAQ